jgi:F1F0 ATPase subunit 2
MIVPATLQIVAGAVIGALTGLAYFSALWWNVGLFEQGATPKAFALLLARFAVLAAVFIGLAKTGAFALLAGAGGLLLARKFLIRRLGKP